MTIESPIVLTGHGIEGIALSKVVMIVVVAPISVPLPMLVIRPSPMIELTGRARRGIL